MSNITRRTFLSSAAALAVTPLVGSPDTLAAQPIQPDVKPKHTFWRNDGEGVYSNTIDDGLLSLMATADGTFLFNLGFTPTKDEIDRLVKSDPSSGYDMTHVMLIVKFFGITPMHSSVPKLEFTWPGMSEYARVGGALSAEGQETQSIDYTVVSLNFGTWEAGRRLKITGSLDDCYANGAESPSVEVWMQPCRTWIVDVTPEHEHWVMSRSQNGEWTHYASLSYGEPSKLYAGQNSRFYF